MRHVLAALRTPLVVGIVLALTVLIAATTVLRNLRDLPFDGEVGKPQAANTPGGVCRFFSH
jgi:hypothetical protein